MAYKPDVSMDFICKHQTPVNYAQLPKLDLGSWPSSSGFRVQASGVKTFSFIMCPLPSSPFINVINRVGEPKLEYFVNNQTNTLHRSHLRGLGGITSLTLCSAGFRELPDNLFKDMMDLTSLDLRSVIIAAIKGAFVPLVNLEFLTLIKNDLQSLPNGVFSHLGRLDTLNLWQTRLTEVHSESFKGLDNLTRLGLSLQDFPLFPDDVFSSLNNLKINYFNHNNVSFLPKNLFANNKNLEAIELYSNIQQLKTLPDDF